MVDDFLAFAVGVLCDEGIGRVSDFALNSRPPSPSSAANRSSSPLAVRRRRLQPL